MHYSITGFAYLTLFFAFGFLTFRFFQYWMKERNLISRLWFYIIIQVEIFALIKTIGGLFFSTNSAFLEMTIDAAAFIESFIFATLAYLIIYIMFPKISPWFGSILVFFLGLTSFVLTVMSSFNPYLEPSGAINWDLSSGSFVVTMSILRGFLALAIFIPIIIIFFQQLKTSKDFYAKRKSLGLLLSLVFASLIMLLDFLLVSFLKVDPIWRDISSIAMGIILFIMLIFTMPRPQTEASYQHIKSSK